MAGKKAAGENSKKASGNSKKAEAAARKAAEEEKNLAAKEDLEWSKGVKSNAKKEAEAAKKAEQARKKAEKDALLAEEEKNARTTPKNSKVAVKKSRRLDLQALDREEIDPKKSVALNATGIDNALDALSLTADSTTKIDKHPERRYKAAYAIFEGRRLKEMDDDGSGQGLRQNQKKEKIRKEFEKHPENPFNQIHANHDATKDEIRELREREREKIEKRLGEQ